MTADGVATNRRALYAVREVLHKDIVTGTTCSTEGVLKYSPVVNWKDTSGPIPVDRNNFGIPLITTTQVLNDTGPSASPISIGSQKIEGPRRSIPPQESRNPEPLDASINQFPSENRDPMPGWSKIIGSKLVTDEISDVYARSQMNFGSDTILSENPNFINFGMSPINTTDKLGSTIVPITRVWMPTIGSNWIHPENDIEESTADGEIKTKAKNHYNFKN